MYKYGKRKPTYDSRDLLYADVRPKSKLPSVPSTFGHGKDFVNWLMLGNGPSESVDDFPSTWEAAKNGAGDCAWCGPAHETMMFDVDARRPISHFMGKVVIEQYAEYCGYSPETGENDNGSETREVLAWRQKKGLRDANGGIHKIGPYVALEPRNLEHLIEACYFFEAVGMGFEVPESAQEQFSAGQPWSVVPGAEIVGGHYVPIVGRPNAGELTVVTWGKRQTLTDQFFSTFCDELWAYITPERLSAITGKDYEGDNAAQLQEFLSLV